MTLSRAIDAFLAYFEVERDATPRSLDSYRRVLDKIDEAHPDADLADFEGAAGTDRLRAILAQKWGSTSSGRRANVISIFHTFFDWVESEDLMDTNPARRIRRPPRRKPDVYRPSESELALIRNAAHLHELPAVLMMEGVGLRAAEVVSLKWKDVDLTQGHVKTLRKGKHWQYVPIAPDVLEDLRAAHKDLSPDPEHYLFSPERELYRGNHRHRVRDPFQPGKQKALWTMVRRICERAGVRPVGPHALRHGFATRLRRKRLPLDAIQALLGHSSAKTTETYLDDILIEDLQDALDGAFGDKSDSQSFSDEETEDDGNPASFPSASGPGRSRTSVLSPPADDPGEDRTSASFLSGRVPNETRTREET